MNKREELLSKLDKLYAENKSKNFVNHLIKAYCSLDKINKVVSKLNSPQTCSLTNKKITSLDEVVSSEVNDSIKTSLSVDVKSAILGKADHSQFLNEYKGKVIGFTANETTTYLSYEAVSVLFEWINQKAKDGDKHIKWVLNQSKPKASVLEQRGYRKPATTMGELSALQQLKEEFQKKGL